MSSKKLMFLFALIIFFLPLNPCLFAQTNDEDEIIKVDVAMVNIPVIVSDKYGRSILGLNIDDFSLFENGKPQKIEYLSTQDTPLNIVLLLDTSRSAQEIINKIKDAAGKFVQQLQPTDRCMIISFADTVLVESEFTSKQIRLDRAIKNLKMSEKPGTLLQDAIFATVDKELAKVKGRKAIILLTDGKDAGSSTPKRDLLHRLVESDTPIYSIFYETTNFIFTPSPPKTVSKQNQKNQPIMTNISQKSDAKTQAKQKQKNTEAADFLLKISDTTAGRIFPREINNLDEAFKNVAEELRKQYLISYYPDDPNYNSSANRIKVKVNKSDVVVRTKNYTRLR